MKGSSGKAKGKGTGGAGAGTGAGTESSHESATAASASAVAASSSSSSHFSLDVRHAVQAYFGRIVNSISGMKALLMDEATKGILSMVFTQSEILSKGVYLTSLVSQKHSRQHHLKAIIFVRPTPENMQELRRELDRPAFGEYHLFFSNMVSSDMLQRIAEADRHEVVKEVQEMYADFFAVNPDLFTLNLADSLRLSRPRPRWGRLEEVVFQQSVDHILALLLAFKRRPVIRFAQSSDLAQHFARQLKHQIDREEDLFHFPRSTNTLLLVLDRRDDPVTPLLTQWTYQAMVHELLGIANNLVDLSKAPGISPEMKNVVLSYGDPFFEQHMYSNYGDLADAVKNLLGTYQKQFHSTKQISTIEDMQAFVESYPEFKKLATNVTKHVAVVGELVRLIDQHHLLDISALEQDLACGNDHNSHLERVKEKLRDPNVDIVDAIRLVLLYALRYETDGRNQLSRLKSMLRDKGCSEEKIMLISKILGYAGASKRGGDLFGDRDLLTKSMKIVNRTITGVSNVFTQHKPLLSDIMEQLKTNRLKEAQYPFVDALKSSRDRPKDVIVFMVGGATFEEAAKVAEFNSTAGNNTRILLGGTTIHNSKSFQEELNKVDF